VQTDAGAAVSVATGTGSSFVDASAMTSGQTLTLTGTHAETANVGGDLSAGGDTGALTVTTVGGTGHKVTTGTGADSITALGGGDTIQGGGGGDNINVMGHSGVDTFAYAATKDSLNTTAGHDTITGFSATSDLLDFSQLNNSQLSVLAAPVASGSSIAANTIAWVNLGSSDTVYVNDTNGALASNSTNNGFMEITLNGVTGSLSASNLKAHA
jgi:hypothetical protein